MTDVAAHGPVTTTRLGRIGFGAAAIGNLFTAVGERTATAAVEAAWMNGIRYFDTAPQYGLGLSERRLGQALAGCPREQYVLSSKVGRLLRPRSESTTRDGVFAVDTDLEPIWDFSRDGVLRSIEESLARLRTDRLDIVYLHDPDRHWRQAADEAAPALAELRDQGVIGAFGAGMNQSAMLTRFVRECGVDIVLMAGRLSLLDSGASDDLLPAAREHRVSVVAAGVFNSGILARPRPSSDATYDYVRAPARALARARAIAEVCERHGVTLPQAAIAHPLRHAGVDCVLLGMRDADEVAENIHAAAVPVPNELWDELIGRGLVRA